MKNYFENAITLKSALRADAKFCLVGGCFDLLHVGHLHLLEFSATLEPILVVAVLTDRYVKTYKNVNRPIIPENQRAVMVAGLKCVTYVYMSDMSPSGSETLSLLQPNTVVFCNESGKEERMIQRIHEIEKVSPGTRVKLLPRYTKEVVSTGHIIYKITSGNY